VFTGLVETIGTIAAVKPFAGGRRVTVAAPEIAGDVKAGDSIACNGVCLTVEAGAERGRRFTVAAVAESLRRTTVPTWRRGIAVHLERALRAGDRLGGHLVQGHVDGVGRVLRAGREGRDFVVTLAVPPELQRYIIPQGSLAVDGVSLTVAARHGTRCRLYLIPETLARTRFGRLRVGERVNLEVDQIAKYVEKLAASDRRREWS